MTSQNNLLLAYFQSRPFAIEKSRLREIVERGNTQAATLSVLSPAQVDAAVQALAAAPLGHMIGSIAVIPIRGCITQKSDFYSWYFGGTSVERLTAAVRQYQNDPQVSTIVFDVDSPGGEVYGVAECFEELHAARGQKKMIAIANPFMASAAYWLACAADELWMMPSGKVGSIGCYTLHEDISKMLERIGVDVTLIQYGEHKTDGNPFEPLSEPAHAELKSGVDFYGILFDKAVAKGRGVSVETVKSSFGQGRMFNAPEAKKVGMVDQAGTLDKLLTKLAPGRSRGFAAGAVATPVVAKAEEKSDTVAPNEDGTCPEGYEKGEDGQCHMPDESAKAAALAAQQQMDADALAALGLLTQG